MARHRHLKNAPVREALIDLQFESPVGLEAVDRFIGGGGASGYEKRLDIWEASFDISSQGARAARSAVGRRLEAKGDPPYVLQCRTGGFTVSRLSPYGKWPELLEEFRRLWTAFVESVGDVVVRRVGVRYINEIAVPLSVTDLGAYFECPPKVPDGLPQAIAGFITRVVIPEPARDCTAIVTQALEAPTTTGPGGESITVLLDVDVFRVVRAGALSSTIWESLAVLRDQKNRMFFEHLTEKTVERYE